MLQAFVTFQSISPCSIVCSSVVGPFVDPCRFEMNETLQVTHMAILRVTRNKRLSASILMFISVFNIQSIILNESSCYRNDFRKQV